MDGKGKVFEPALEQKELGYTYRKTGPEPYDKCSWYDIIPVNEAKSHGERNRSQTELHRRKQPPTCIGF
jgi:hypothetical protein